MKIKSIEEFYLEGINYVLVEFENGKYQVFTEAEFKNEYPNEIQSTLSKTPGGSGIHFPKPKPNPEGGGGGIILGIIFLVLLYNFWNPIMTFFRLLPLGIVAIEAVIIIVFIYKKYKKYSQEKKIKLSFLGAIFGGLSGFGLAIIFGFIYAFIIFIYNIFDMKKYKEVGNLMNPQMDIFMISTIVVGIICGSFEEDDKEWLKAIPLFLVVIFYFYSLHKFG